MRDDQVKRLGELQQEIAEQFLTAAHPQSWSGAGQDPSSMTPEVRGARNWDVKNANQLGALLVRTMDIADRMAGNLGPAFVPADDAADADIAKYERQAKKLLESVGAKRGKA